MNILPPAAMDSERSHRPPAVSAAGAPIRRMFAGAALLVCGAAAWWWLATHHFTGGEDADEAAPRNAAAVAPPVVVGLPASLSRDEIAFATVETRRLRAHLTVPGRLDYDARSRLDYASPVDGVVSRLFVVVRQSVARGDSLAEVSSPEVGRARDEVRKRHDDLEIARQAAEWAVTIADNLQLLLTALERHPAIDDVERQFKDRMLGEYREKIVGAYSRLLYVEKVDAGTKQLGEGGVLAARIIDERASNLEVARASFRASCERARFDTQQARDTARAAFAQAERLSQVAREHLRNLVGGEAENAVADDGAASSDGISAIALRTPFDGLVEDIFVSRGQRVQGGERMFVVADTRQLWVRAQIHEKQWTMVDVTEGQEVRVVVPGSAEHRTSATINHVAATVDAESRSVAIVADLENDDAHYKPGMFVWVELPQGEPRDAPTVPSPAVMRHEGKAFVFVPVEGGFRRVDVETGIESEDFIEVTRGLEVGQQVVSRGAFVLKSELLLEDEG